MSASVPLPGSPAVRLLWVSWPVVLADLVLGPPAYFIAFLFAYGFRDEVGWAEHTAFLVMVAVFATCAGLLAAAVPTGRAFGDRAAVAVLTSAALNALVVAAGGVVSATHKAEGSVSADFSTTTDVLVVVGLLAVAVACAVGAVAAERRGGVVSAGRARGGARSPM